MRRRAGMTLIELLISMVITTVIIGSIVTLVITQTRYASSTSDDMTRLSEAATAQQLLRAEVTELPRSAITFAGRDSLVFRLPIRWGVICGPIDRHTKATSSSKKSKKGSATTYSTTLALELSPAASQLGSPNPEGLAVSSDGSTFTWVPLASWSASGITASPTASDACLTVTNVLATDKKSKGGKKSAPAAPTTTVTSALENYYQSASLSGLLGSAPEERTLIAAWITVRYFFRSENGTRTLFRSTASGTDRVAAPFASTAGFAYRLANGAVSTSTTSFADIRAIQADLPALPSTTRTTAADALSISPWLTLYNAR